MKTLPTEIKFKCPACEQPMAGSLALARETVTCPKCAHPFAPADPMAEMEYVDSKPDQAKELSARVKNIRSNASVMVVMALVMLVIAVICILAEQAMAAAGCVGVALWLYLIAQVIHIRANTER